MSPASLLRPLFSLLFVGLTTIAIAKSDSTAAPTPVLYKREAHFSRRYDPKLKPDRLAVPLHPVPIVYPAKWRQWGQPAYAVIEFLVKDTGAPDEVQCTEATDRVFAKAAEAAVEQSYFIPALINQQGVTSKVVHRFEFLIDPTKPAATPVPAPAKP